MKKFTAIIFAVVMLVSVMVLGISAAATDCPEHDWSAYVTIKVEDNGTLFHKQATCACGEESDVIKVHVCKLELVEAVPGTCKEPGTAAYLKCAGEGCDKGKIFDLEGNPITAPEKPYGDHNLKYVEAKRPTCTENGTFDYYECTVCKKLFWDGAEITEEDIVDFAMNHDRPEYHAPQIATCDSVGNIEYWTCGVCNAYLVKEGEGFNWKVVTREDVIILPLVHIRAEKIDAKLPTCDEAGNIEYYLCGTCGKYLLKDNENQVWVETTREDILILPIGHERISPVEAVAATHTLAGNQAYWYCDACSRYFADRAATEELFFPQDIVVLPEGHIRAEKIEAVRATCTENGSIEYYYCAECDKNYTDRSAAADELTDEELVLLASGHQRPVKIDAARATCTEAGNIEYYVCNACGAYLLKDDEAQAWEVVDRLDVIVLPIGHDRPEHFEAVRATCTEGGNIEYWLCGVCGKYLIKDNENMVWEEVTREDVVILSMGHVRPEHFEAKRATCTEAGNIEYWLCGVCGEYLIKNDETQTWDIVTREDVVILSMGHQRPEIVEAVYATCDTVGNIEYFVCGVCGEYLIKDNENQTWEIVTREEVIILPLGHERAELVEAQAPTCIAIGNIEYFWCNACGKYLLKDNENQIWIETTREEIILDIVDHDFESVDATPPSCTESGNLAYEICKVCGYTVITDPTIPGGSHTMVKVPAKEATCFEDGNNEYYICAVCQQYAETVNGVATNPQNEKIPAAHKFEKVAAKAATCTSDGNNEYNLCSACGAAETVNGLPTTAKRETIPGGHTLVKVEAKAPTATEAGNNEYYICSVCNEYAETVNGVATTPKAETIPAIGETEKPEETTPPTTDNPNTADSNNAIFFIVAIVAVVALGAAAVCFKRREN